MEVTIHPVLSEDYWSSATEVQFLKRRAVARSPSLSGGQLERSTPTNRPYQSGRGSVSSSGVTIDSPRSYDVVSERYAASPVLQTVNANVDPMSAVPLATWKINTISDNSVCAASLPQHMQAHSQYSTSPHSRTRRCARLMRQLLPYIFGLAFCAWIVLIPGLQLDSSPALHLILIIGATMAAVRHLRHCDRVLLVTLIHQFDFWFLSIQTVLFIAFSVWSFHDNFSALFAVAFAVPMFAAMLICLTFDATLSTPYAAKLLCFATVPKWRCSSNFSSDILREIRWASHGTASASCFAQPPCR